MAFRYLSFAGWILVALSSNMENALNPDDECAADAGDCSVELTQLRGVKHDVLVSGNESSFNSSAFPSSGAGLLSIVADSATGGCDWSGQGEFCKNWKTCVCGKRVTVLDVGALVIQCVALPALCASEATRMLTEVIGTSVAEDLVKQMLERKSQVTLPSGKSAKAGIVGGTRCRTCPVDWVPCIPQPNEHRLCVAWDKKPANAPPKRSLLYITKKGGGSGKTEVQKFSGASRFRDWFPNKATVLGETDANWAFEVKFDGTIAAINKAPPPGAMVHFLDGPSLWQKFQYQGRILAGEDLIKDAWDFYVKPNGDILGCKGKNTGTKSTEIHMLKARSGWTEIGLQTGTALIEKQTARGQECFMNQNDDLVVVYWWWTGSGEVEVHVAPKSENYMKTSVSTRTGLPQSKPWKFTMAPNGDIYAVRPRSDGYFWWWLLKPSDYSKVADSGNTGKAVGRLSEQQYDFLVWDEP